MLSGQNVVLGLIIQHVQLHGVVAVNVLVRVEKLFLEQNDIVFGDALFAEGFVRVEPFG